jgi:hypothetical protein
MFDEILKNLAQFRLLDSARYPDLAVATNHSREPYDWGQQKQIIWRTAISEKNYVPS